MKGKCAIKILPFFFICCYLHLFCLVLWRGSLKLERKVIDRGRHPFVNWGSFSAGIRSVPGTRWITLSLVLSSLVRSKVSTVTYLLFTIQRKKKLKNRKKVNGKTVLVWQNRKFSKQTGRLERKSKLSNLNIPTENAFTLYFYVRVPGLSPALTSIRVY